MNDRTFAERLAALEALESDTLGAEDADALAPDDALALALAAMGTGAMGWETWRAPSPAARARFRADVAHDAAFWSRVAERADMLRRQRTLLLLPFDAATIAALLDDLERGRLQVRPWGIFQQPPETVISTRVDASPRNRLDWLLKQVCAQLARDVPTTTDDAIALVLVLVELPPAP